MPPTASPSPAAGPAPSAEGHGRRLLAAFERLEHFPALAESRRRLDEALRKPQGGQALLPIVESDLALAIGVLRAANRTGRFRRGVGTLREALDKLSMGALEALAQETDAVEFFERDPTWDLSAQRFRVHAVATQRAADRIARESGHREREELATAALLHDIGKLVLSHAYSDYPEGVIHDARTPEARVAAERRALGLDHAVVGGVLARRWGLPDRLATLIEHHHDGEATGGTAILRLADMLAHYGSGAPVEPRELLNMARATGLDARAVRAALYEVPFRSDAARRVEPSPLSAREADVIRGLASGKRYREIAADLGVSESTTRTHLQSAYKKLGVSDRAQVVLLATERGWI